ncbi:MAG: ATP synthase F1 subunit epsilon [Treponema sp.]|jgi:F-type H+-transporting ATPase subunit epsilon|nr:ATP synthase F1 subunit epsilon [Treponema sp.]
MAAVFKFEIHTLYRLFFTGEVQAIILNLADGEACVYANHSGIIAPVVECMLRIKDKDGNWLYASVSCGILEVKENKNVLIVETAEWPEEINRERALESKRQAEEDLLSAQFKFEKGNAKARLRRAQCRLKVLDLCSTAK